VPRRVAREVLSREHLDVRVGGDLALRLPDRGANREVVDLDDTDGQVRMAGAPQGNDLAQLRSVLVGGRAPGVAALIIAAVGLVAMLAQPRAPTVPRPPSRRAVMTSRTPTCIAGATSTAKPLSAVMPITYATMSRSML
jgi:hypothetical protein